MSIVERIRPRRVGQERFLYVMFFQNTRVYKIGRSFSPSRRRCTLASSTGEYPVVLAKVAHAGHLETRVLRCAGKPLHSREFFSETEELKRWRENKLPLKLLPFLSDELRDQLEIIEEQNAKSDNMPGKRGPRLTTKRVFLPAEPDSIETGPDEWDEVTTGSGWLSELIQNMGYGNF